MPERREDHDVYDSPLVTRYAGPRMAALWSPARKIRTWRRLWIALAEAQKELGLPISEEQIAEMRRHAEDVDFERAEKLERE